jgi:hypothetical protein
VLAPTEPCFSRIAEAPKRRTNLGIEDKVLRRKSLRTIAHVSFEIVTWAPSEADVDLSIACMFERDMPGTTLSGGLLQLDEALGAALTNLRNEGSFRAQEMETLLIPRPPTQMPARGILIIGLGDPLSLNFAVLERALRVAIREANRLGASTVAFAPNLLDAGLKVLPSLHVEAAMVRGVISALNAEIRLSELGLAPPPSIRNWSFETGSTHFDAATEAFLRAFNPFVVSSARAELGNPGGSN